jgi:hypothetical protein
MVKNKIKYYGERMKTQVKLIAIIFSLSILMSGCNGKEIDSMENDITDQEISESAIAEITSDNDADDIVDIPAVEPSDDVEIETDINPVSNDSSEKPDSEMDSEIDPEIASYMEFNYDEVDVNGLSKETLDLFVPCAIYLENGSNTYNEDILSSKEWDDIAEFLFYFINTGNKNVEFIHDYVGEELLTKQWRIKYEEWEYLLKEVLKEKNPQNVIDMMDTEFGGEMGVYYNPDDNYIYKEVGTIGWGYEEAKVREVRREGDTYIITYDLYSGFTEIEAPYSAVEVTIIESPNKYGYSLVSVAVIREFDVWY